MPKSWEKSEFDTFDPPWRGEGGVTPTPAACQKSAPGFPVLKGDREEFLLAASLPTVITSRSLCKNCIFGRGGGGGGGDRAVGTPTSSSDGMSLLSGEGTAK